MLTTQSANRPPVRRVIQTTYPGDEMRRAFLARTLPHGEFRCGEAGVVTHGAGGAVGTTGTFRGVGFHGSFDAAETSRPRAVTVVARRRLGKLVFPGCKVFDRRPFVIYILGGRRSRPTFAVPPSRKDAHPPRDQLARFAAEQAGALWTSRESPPPLHGTSITCTHGS